MSKGGGVRICEQRGAGGEADALTPRRTGGSWDVVLMCERGAIQSKE